MHTHTHTSVNLHYSTFQGLITAQAVTAKFICKAVVLNLGRQQLLNVASLCSLFYRMWKKTLITYFKSRIDRMVESRVFVSGLLSWMRRLLESSRAVRLLNRWYWSRLAVCRLNKNFDSWLCELFTHCEVIILWTISCGFLLLKTYQDKRVEHESPQDASSVVQFDTDVLWSKRCQCLNNENNNIIHQDFCINYRGWWSDRNEPTWKNKGNALDRLPNMFNE